MLPGFVKLDNAEPSSNAHVYLGDDARPRRKRPVDTGMLVGRNSERCTDHAHSPNCEAEIGDFAGGRQ